MSRFLCVGSAFGRIVFAAVLIGLVFFAVVFFGFVFVAVAFLVISTPNSRSNVLPLPHTARARGPRAPRESLRKPSSLMPGSSRSCPLDAISRAQSESFNGANRAQNADS